MRNTFLAPVMMGLAVSSLAASAGESATRIDAPALTPFSGVYADVEARKDYRRLGKVTYGRRDRIYHFVYTAKDGSEKHLMIDAVTGRAIPSATIEASAAG